jgi:hypothetical protein
LAAALCSPPKFLVLKEIVCIGRNLKTTPENGGCNRVLECLSQSRDQIPSSHDDTDFPDNGRTKKGRRHRKRKITESAEDARSFPVCRGHRTAPVTRRSPWGATSRTTWGPPAVRPAARCTASGRPCGRSTWATCSRTTRSLRAWSASEGWGSKDVSDSGLY